MCVETISAIKTFIQKHIVNILVHRYKVSNKHLLMTVMPTQLETEFQVILSDMVVYQY